MYENHVQVDTVYIDFSKAFDSVCHARLLSKLWNLSIRGLLHQWIASYLSHRCQAMRVSNWVSDSQCVPSGVPQGSHLGPLLFIAFINDLPGIIQNSQVLLYADDVKLYRDIKSPLDASLLQLDVDRLCSWATENGLDINRGKCKVLSFGRAQSTFQYQYLINGQPVERVFSFSDLGVIHETSFSFSTHINPVSSKCLRLLGFIKRSTSDFCNPDTIIHLYKALILPHITYASIIWTPSTVTHTKSLDSVIHLCLRLAAFKARRPMLFTDHDYSPLYTYFNLLPINRIHYYYDLLFMFKVLNQVLSSPEVDGLFSARHPPYELRRYNVLLEETHTTAHDFSAPVPRLRRLWNAIPPAIQNIITIT